MVRALRVALAVAGLVLLAEPASAHNVLIGSTPEDGARLKKAPYEVTLRFNQPVRHGYDTIAVTGPDRGRYESGRTMVSGRTVRVSMRPAGPAGRYTVGYRILSADGHPVTGEVHFTLTTPGTGSPAPSSEFIGTARDDGNGATWLWISGATLVAMLALVLALRRRNAPR